MKKTRETTPFGILTRNNLGLFMFSE